MSTKAAAKVKLALSFFIITLYTLHFTPRAAFAAPAYGTKMPQRNKLFAGLGQYNVLKRYLEHSAGKMRSLQNFVLLSYGIFDWLSIDLKGGAGYIKQHPLDRSEIDYPTFLGGGYGLRLRLYEKKNIKAVFGFQHISIHPETTVVENQKNKAVLDDWQFSLLASYDFKKFTPYIGTRWSRMDYIHWTDGTRDRVKSDRTKDVGLIVGVDVPLIKNTWVNIEGNFIDSTAYAFSLNYGF